MKTKNNRTSLQKTSAMKKAYRIFCMAILSAMCLCAFVFASGNAALNAVNNLSSFVFAVIRVVGIMVAGWGVVQFAQSLPAHDASQRTTGILTFVGGLLIIFAKEIINAVAGAGTI